MWNLNVRLHRGTRQKHVFVTQKDVIYVDTRPDRSYQSL